MRDAFGKQMELLNAEMAEMGDMCEASIACAMKALFEADMGMAEKTLEYEKQIDQKEKDIENLCMRLLLRQQPVATDLRTVSSALKMISDMERIGDQAEDIVEILEYMEAEKLPQEENLDNMAKAAASMVNQAIESFIKKDLQMAEKVILDDDIVDRYFDKVKKDLILMIAQNPQKGELYLDLLMIAKYLERIADHATNIAEWVAYGISGSHIV